MEQTLTLTEREVNLVRYALEKEHDYLAKELLTATERWCAASENGFYGTTAELKTGMEETTRRINEVSELMKKI